MVQNIKIKSKRLIALCKEIDEWKKHSGRDFAVYIQNFNDVSLLFADDGTRVDNEVINFYKEIYTNDQKYKLYCLLQ